MRFWLALIGLIALVVVGSRAFAGTEQPAPPAVPASAEPAGPTGPTGPAAPTEQAGPPAPAEPGESAAPAVSPEQPAASTTRPVSPRKLAPLASAYGLIAVRGEAGIYLVDPDSGEARTVPGSREMTAPAWSPDAKLLAVEQAGSVYTVGPDGSDARLVLKDASSASWSAAGDRIYAVRGECATPCEPEDDAANVLVSVRPDGTDARRIDFEDTEVYAGRDFPWATDGSSIGFFADESPTGPGSFDSSAAAWSPDGTRLCFVGAVGPAEDDTAADPGPTGLWVVSADGGTPQLLFKGASGRPSWAP